MVKSTKSIRSRSGSPQSYPDRRDLAAVRDPPGTLDLSSKPQNAVRSTRAGRLLGETACKSVADDYLSVMRVALGLPLIAADRFNRVSLMIDSTRKNVRILSICYVHAGPEIV